MDKYTQSLKEGKFYHVYNQGNNGENLFYNDGNYVYFMKKFEFYLSPYVKLFAFCLMPNHFHLLVRIKEIKELDEMALNEIETSVKPVRSSRPNRFNDEMDEKPKNLLGFENLTGLMTVNEKPNRFNIDDYSLFISNKFRLFFMSYSKALNKQIGRRGSLFRDNFKRKEITNLQYLKNTIVYIHRNPLHHGFEEDFSTFRWSSYNRILEDKITKLHKNEVLQCFDNSDNYKYMHLQQVEDDIENE